VTANSRRSAPGAILMLPAPNAAGALSRARRLTQAETMRGLLRMCPWACYDRPAAAAHLGLLARLARQAAGFELHAGRDLLGDAAYSADYLRGLAGRANV